MAGFIPLILIFGLMYVLMIRPQQKKVKAQQALVSSIQSGDEVVLNSGIFGVVKDVEDDILWLEVYDGIELKVLRGSVDGRFNEPTADDGDSDDESGEDSDHDSGDGPIVG
jgi:preprotein translocase subunit YajC